MLAPDIGLADQLGLDPQFVRKAAQTLWKKHAVIRADEAEYWRDLETAISVPISVSDVAAVEDKLFKANDDIPQVLRLSDELGFDLGILSDTTSFWFPKQMDVTGMLPFVQKDLVFLSYQHGRLKEDTCYSLFEVAAERIPAYSTLIIDDRQGNISIAETFGFRTLLYKMASCNHSLSSVISSVFNDNN